MIPYDIDPSLHGGEPAPAVLDDGFSPPRAPQPAPVVVPDASARARDAAASTPTS